MTISVGMVAFLVLGGAAVVAGGRHGLDNLSVEDLVMFVAGGAAVVARCCIGPNDRSFEDLVKFVTDLENDLNSANSDLSNIVTLSAAIDERFNLINDRRLHSINLRNSQQDDLIEQFEKQASGLGDRDDTARAHVARAADSVKQTDAILRRQRDNSLTRNMERNDRQADDISILGATIVDLEQEFLDKLSDNLANLTKRRNDAAVKILQLEDFVDTRKCEYGTASIKAGDTYVAFLTTFTEAPTVAMVIDGFSAHLDGYGYSKYDRLTVNRKVKGVSVDGFSVSAEDLSEGMAEVNDVFISYMACLFLDRDVIFTVDYSGGGGK